MSCLFESLSKFIIKNNTSISPKLCRELICDKLESNYEIFEDLTIETIIKLSDSFDIKDYINEMRKPSTWGGGLEIKAFCDIFKVFVVVVHRNRYIEFRPDSYDKAVTIYINYNDSANHYEPLRSMFGEPK